jgi:hypothetical protein
VAHAVEIACVEQVDTGIDCGVNGSDTFGFISRTI